jgi:hypothetical protein
MGDGQIRMSLADRLYYWQDRIAHVLVCRFMPRYLAYLAFARVWAAADEQRSSEGYATSDLTCEEAMRRWENGA